MANAINDGLNLPSQLGSYSVDNIELGSGAVLSSNLGSPITVTASGNSVFQSLNGQAIDFGVTTGSGNARVITFARTFAAAPNVVALPTVGSVAVTGQPVLADIGTGSFTLTTGSNVATYWLAIGSGSY